MLKIGSFFLDVTGATVSVAPFRAPYVNIRPENEFSDGYLHSRHQG